MRLTLPRKTTLAALLAATTLLSATPLLAQSSGTTQPNWSGLYFGWGWGLGNVDLKGSYVTSAAVNKHNVDATSQFRGGFVGLQHQWGQFVLGVEANYGGTGWSDDWDARANSANSGCLAVLANAECRGRLDSIFTVGPRLGFAPSAKWLVFATGGYASGRIDTAVHNRTTDTEIGRSSNRHDGWFAGAGIEYNYSENWTFGLEYQHLALETARHFDSKFGPAGVITPETRDISADADVIRMRTTFKLNRPAPTPAAMK